MTSQHAKIKTIYGRAQTACVTAFVCLALCIAGCGDEADGANSAESAATSPSDPTGNEASAAPIHSTKLPSSPETGEATSPSTPTAPEKQPEKPEDPSEKPAAADAPTDNAWKLPPRPAAANQGDRVYAMTRGRDRTYTDATAVYQLYAYDVASAHGNDVTLQELGGGRFTVPGLFVIPGGTTVKSLRKGDMVLAEWASSLKHAIVTGFDGTKATVRYTDLPESWAEEKITATKDARELTKQQNGFHPGNYAIATIDDEKFLVMLVSKSDETWLVRRFAGRIAGLHRSKLTPLPLKPKMRRRQKVMAPWIGMMYPGKVAKVVGARVLVRIDGIGQPHPIAVPFGQVLPLSR